MGNHRCATHGKRLKKKEPPLPPGARLQTPEEKDAMKRKADAARGIGQVPAASK